MIEESTSNSLDKLIWFFTICLFSSMYIFGNLSIGSYILMLFTGLILIFVVVSQKGKIFISFNLFFKYMVVLIIYIFLSTFWALDKSMTITRGITLLEILICMSVLYMHFKKFEENWSLVNAIRYAGFIVMIYTYISYGIGHIISVLYSLGRLDDKFINVNSLALLLGTSVIITFCELLYYRFKAVNIIMSGLCIIVIVASGSRKALVYVLLGILLLLLYKFSSKSFFRNIVRWGFIIIIFFFLLKYLSGLSFFAGIMKRMNGMLQLIGGNVDLIDASTSERVMLIKIGVEQFKETPILGIGMGSSGKLILQMTGRPLYYLHNNFVELLCCGGIVGLVIYYSIFLYETIIFIAKRNKSNPITGLCLTLIILMLIMDYGRVSYIDKMTYVYLLLFSLQVKLILKNSTKKMSEKVS